MPWAAKRRLLISIILGAVAVAFLFVVGIATVYQEPTCSDKVQNQGEYGVDCGGPCAYLCREQTLAPTVLFAKAVVSTGGRIDVAALIENKNPAAAAKNVPYRIQLFGKDRLPVADLAGTVDLPPGASVPIYIPGAASGKQPIASTFLSIDPASVAWYALSRDPRTVPAVGTISETGAATAPRITAVLLNPSVLSLSGVRAVVFVSDVERNIIAASQTILPFIPAQGSATATFTWNAPFATTTAEIRVMPVVPLP